MPFNIRVPAQTTGGAANWVGEGAASRVTKFDFDALTLRWTKVAAISRSERGPAPVLDAERRAAGAAVSG